MAAEAITVLYAPTAWPGVCCTRCGHRALAMRIHGRLVVVAHADQARPDCVSTTPHPRLHSPEEGTP